MRKIFALPSHQTEQRTSGVDFARIIQPMKYLDKQKGFKVTNWTTDMKLLWPKVAEKHDAVYFSYLNNQWGFAVMGACFRHFGKKIIMDIDDALPLIKSDNVAYDIFKKGSEGITTIKAIAQEVDQLTCTNQYLKNILITYFDLKPEKITVIDNHIDLDLYSHRSPFKDTHQISIMHFGSATHFHDLAYPSFSKAIERLMNEYPNLEFHTVGSFFPDISRKYGRRYKQSFGDVDVYKWIKDKYPAIMDQTDIVVAPLIPDAYNKGKSGIKYLEYSAAVKPGVYQDVHQYQKYIKNGVNGYLATYENDWYDALKKLIDDKELRRKMGEEAFKTIQDHTIQKNVEQYEALFNEVLDRPNE